MVEGSIPRACESCDYMKGSTPGRVRAREPLTKVPEASERLDDAQNPLAP